VRIKTKNKIFLFQLGKQLNHMHMLNLLFQIIQVI